MITISRYMPNESEYAICVDLVSVRLYYSYETIIAFWIMGEGITVCENIWSRTTGKHINYLRGVPGTVAHVHPAVFGQRLSTLMHRIEYALTHLELARRIEEAGNERMGTGSGG